ncbi:hypothetical protein DSO57_1006751 [Entomophthora muscae]|uniref:Uncharacterized protein n=1 Tax=Entomophthora muscae TaxID=34485 RepID=A0ACC2RM84_9FUNG|nr:hypothetical protein DSO57_1006751 [Entomophthora muscae]
MCNPFATEAKAKKEAPALEALEARLKDITAKSEKVFLAQEQSGNCDACPSRFDEGYSKPYNLICYNCDQYIHILRNCSVLCSIWGEPTH